MATFPSITPQYSTQESVGQDSLRIILNNRVTMNLTFEQVAEP